MMGNQPITLLNLARAELSDARHEQSSVAYYCFAVFIKENK